MFNTKTIEINNFIFPTKQSNSIQCVPTSEYSSKFVTLAPSLIFRQIISRINTIESTFRFDNNFVFQILLKDKVALEIHFISVTSS